MRNERSPDTRYHATLRATAEPGQAYEKALWQLLQGRTQDESILRVVDIYEDAFERELLQAWIIAGATDEDLHERLGIAKGVIGPYRHLCCNPAVFRDKLELLRWVQRYPGTREGKILLERAVHFDNVEAVAHLCGLPSKLDGAHVNAMVMRETYFRGTGTLRGASISSTEAAAAHNMLKTAMTAAAASLKSTVPNLAETLMKLNLKHRELTYSADDVVPRGEIMN